MLVDVLQVFYVLVACLRILFVCFSHVFVHVLHFLHHVNPGRTLAGCWLKPVPGRRARRFGVASIIMLDAAWPPGFLVATGSYQLA